MIRKMPQEPPHPFIHFQEKNKLDNHMKNVVTIIQNYKYRYPLNQKFHAVKLVHTYKMTNVPELFVAALLATGEMLEA